MVQAKHQLVQMMTTCADEASIGADESSTGADDAEL